MSYKKYSGLRDKMVSEILTNVRTQKGERVVGIAIDSNRQNVLLSFSSMREANPNATFDAERFVDYVFEKAENECRVDETRRKNKKAVAKCFAELKEKIQEAITRAESLIQESMNSAFKSTDDFIAGVSKNGVTRESIENLVMVWASQSKSSNPEIDSEALEQAIGNLLKVNEKLIGFEMHKIKKILLPDLPGTTLDGSAFGRSFIGLIDTKSNGRPASNGSSQFGEKQSSYTQADNGNHSKARGGVKSPLSAKEGERERFQTQFQPVYLPKKTEGNPNSSSNGKEKPVDTSPLFIPETVSKKIQKEPEHSKEKVGLESKENWNKPTDPKPQFKPETSPPFEEIRPTQDSNWKSEETIFVLEDKHSLPSTPVKEERKEIDTRKPQLVLSEEFRTSSKSSDKQKKIFPPKQNLNLPSSLSMLLPKYLMETPEKQLVQRELIRFKNKPNKIPRHATSKASGDFASSFMASRSAFRQVLFNFKTKLDRFTSQPEPQKEVPIPRRFSTINPGSLMRIPHLTLTDGICFGNRGITKTPNNFFAFLGKDTSYCVAKPDEKLTVLIKGKLPLPDPGNCCSIVPHPSGSFFLVSHFSGKQVLLFDSELKRLNKTFVTTSNVMRAAWINSNEFVTVQKDGTVAKYNSGTTIPLFSVNFFSKSIYDMVLCGSNNSEMICGDENCFIFRVGDLQSKEILWKQKHHSTPVISLALSPSEKYLAASEFGGPRKVFVLLAETGELVWEMKAQEDLKGSVWTMKWSPEENILLVQGFKDVLLFGQNAFSGEWKQMSRIKMKAMAKSFFEAMEVDWEAGVILLGNETGNIFKLTMSK